jgi:hypothetical protein
MTGETESRMLAVFHVVDRITNGKVTSTVTVTVEELGDDASDVREGRGRYVVRRPNGTVDHRFTAAVDAMRHGLDLAGWWAAEPTQL